MTYRGRDYLVVVDYCSKYPEVSLLPDNRASSIIMHTKSICARHGIPDEIVSANMSFGSREFKNFAYEWGIKTITSSPTYAQSNGLAERSVQTLKGLFKKADEDGRDPQWRIQGGFWLPGNPPGHNFFLIGCETLTCTDLHQPLRFVTFGNPPETSSGYATDPYLVLLEYRNTPVSGLQYTPSQVLMRRLLRSKLPTKQTLLQPNVKNAHCDLRCRHQRQKMYYENPPL